MELIIFNFWNWTIFVHISCSFSLLIRVWSKLIFRLKISILKFPKIKLRFNPYLVDIKLIDFSTKYSLQKWNKLYEYKFLKKLAKNDLKTNLIKNFNQTNETPLNRISKWCLKYQMLKLKVVTLFYKAWMSFTPKIDPLSKIL